MTQEGPKLELRVSLGRTEVRLPEAPTSGYRWRLDDPPDAVTLVESDFDPPSGGRAGGEGERIFILEVEAEGRHVLDFLLARAAGDPVEQRTVTLIAAEG